MFETVVVESKRHPIRKGSVAVLPVSIALHALAIGGVIASSVWSVPLPTNAPAQYEAFAGVRPMPAMAVERPPVKVEPPPKGEPPKGPESIFTQQPVSNPTTLTPIAVPDTIPDVDPGGGGLPEVPVGDPSLVGPGSGGIDLGDGNGAPVEVGPGRATMPVVLKRVQPVYPKLLVSVGLRGSAVVECVVGRDGVIESARVVRATHQLFGDAARDAVMEWKFLPGRLRGDAVATVFQLTVTFEVQR
jgi:TonB family protein